MKSIIVFSTLLLSLFYSCSKDKTAVEPPVTPQDSTVNPKDTTKVPPFSYKTMSVRMYDHFVDGTVDEKMFVGSIWHFKDTTNGLQIESIQDKYKAFEIAYYSENPIFSVETFTPSYEKVKNYAKSYQESTQSQSIRTSSETFSDYKFVKQYLANNEDAKKILELVKHNDSTNVVKPYNSLRTALVINFSIDADHMSYFYKYTAEDLQKFKSDGYNPYLIRAANYGQHLMILAESDSVRVSLNKSIDKLLNENPLDTIDEKVLNASNILIYYRGGGKDSFVQHAKNAAAIKTMFSAFQIAYKRKDNIYDYPISFFMMKIEDYSVLNYYYKFDILVKNP